LELQSLHIIMRDTTRAAARRTTRTARTTLIARRALLSQEQLEDWLESMINARCIHDD